MLKNTGGYYYEPTVFDNVKNNMKIAQEEIFGPVLTSITFKDSEEALKIAMELKKKLIENNINMVCLDKLKKFN